VVVGWVVFVVLVGGGGGGGGVGGGGGGGAEGWSTAVQRESERRESHLTNR
jgi:hypothetical protein